MAIQMDISKIQYLSNLKFDKHKIIRKAAPVTLLVFPPTG